jgi:AAA15 family ATPase/GTPase
MLVEFSVDNYLSFRDKCKIKMEAGTIKEHSENIHYPIFSKDLKLIKCGVLYGANASGKSNLLKAFSFVRQFVLNSSKESQATEDIKIEPFRLNTSNLDKPSSFEIVFLIDDFKYRYGFTVTTKKVVEEWLFFSEKRKEEKLFARSENQISVDQKLLNEPKNKIELLKELTRPNSLFISVLSQFNISLGDRISSWFSNTVVAFEVNNSDLINYTATLLKKPHFKIKIHEIILKSDLGFSSIEAIIKEKVNKSNYSEEFMSFFYNSEQDYSIKTTHSVFDDKKKQKEFTVFDLIKNESLGTQKFIALLGVVLEALFEKKVIWIDELDSRFHELLLKMIVNLFNSNQNNPNGAQLICTCHNTSLLKRMLRRDQMFFSEKDELGSTSVSSLYQKDPSIRNDASFEKDYTAGKYGAIPKIQQLNLFKDY